MAAVTPMYLVCSILLTDFGACVLSKEAMSDSFIFSFFPSCLVRSISRFFTSSLVSSISFACFTYTLYSSISVSNVVALAASASFTCICWNTCATVSPCSIALSRSIRIRSSPVDSSRPSDTSVVPSTPSIIAAISLAISCNVSSSRPFTCTVMPLPPSALISIVDVSIATSAWFASRISAIFVSISLAISTLSFSLSSLNDT